jgi:hypothetical protein
MWMDWTFWRDLQNAIGLRTRKSAYAFGTILIGRSNGKELNVRSYCDLYSTSADDEIAKWKGEWYVWTKA